MSYAIYWETAGSAQRVRRMRLIAALLDNAVEVPGIRVKVGLDPILGLVPVWGDVIGLLGSLWIVYEAWRLGASGRVLAMMVMNVLLDTGLGAVPILGDLFDFAWKANTRNLRLMGIEPMDGV